MTEIALLPQEAAQAGAVDSDEVTARIRRRYRAEWRFQAYGIAAITIAALFVVLLMTDIIRKGLPAFTEYRMALNVTLDPEKIDPTGARDRQALQAADYASIVRDALRAQFPDATDRVRRRLLDGLLSSGAADDLRRMVVSDPSLIGRDVKAPVLLSADADLYFKGNATRIARTPGRGSLSILGETGGELSLSSTSNDFAAELIIIKRALAERARSMRTEADRLETTARGLVAAARDGLLARVAELRATAAQLQERFDRPQQDEALDSSLPSRLVEFDGGLVKLTEIGNARAKGTILLPLASRADARPGEWRVVTYLTPETNRRIGDLAVSWLERLKEKKLVESAFAWRLLTSGDSREPELAGIKGALIGSALTLMITLALCLPIGVGAAVYLEEFAPKNRITDLIEVNINNLAAVPSIVFGLLGLAMFLNFFGLPRSAPLVGGLVLALLVLPTIIIASRAAMRAVPPSIKEAALGVGASQQQAIFHHILPLAMPGIMTGTIIGMAHALGETAPLLLIGMVAFIVDVPGGFTQAATALPVQIYLWSDLPEVAFQAKTAAAIMVLLAFLFFMNGAAIVLRRRFERRW